MVTVKQFSEYISRSQDAPSTAQRFDHQIANSACVYDKRGSGLVLAQTYNLAPNWHSASCIHGHASHCAGTTLTAQTRNSPTTKLANPAISPNMRLRCRKLALRQR